MERSTRSSLVLGIILILLGALFLVFQLFPQLGQWINWSTGWPLIIVGVGLVFLVAAVLSGASGLAIPGTIVGGIGGDRHSLGSGVCRPARRAGDVYGRRRPVARGHNPPEVEPPPRLHLGQQAVDDIDIPKNSLQPLPHGFRRIILRGECHCT